MPSPLPISSGNSKPARFKTGRSSELSSKRRSQPKGRERHDYSTIRHRLGPDTQSAGRDPAYGVLADETLLMPVRRDGLSGHDSMQAMERAGCLLPELWVEIRFALEDMELDVEDDEPETKSG